MVPAIISWIEPLWEFLQGLGYYGIALGLMVEFIPSEIVLSYGGYLVWQGKIHFAGALLAGTIGGVLAQWFLYLIGYWGGRPFLERYGRYLLLRRHHLDIADRWFQKYGSTAIFVARFIPIVRHAISIPAGIARMPSGRFFLLTTLAILPWSAAFLGLGYMLGEHWQRSGAVLMQYVRPCLPYLVAIFTILLIGWWGRYWYRKRRPEEETKKETEEGDSL